MFYCSLHSWYSSEQPCPACHKTYTTITTTTTSPVADTPEQTTKEGFVWTDELVKEYASKWIEAASANENYISVESFKASKQSLSNTPVFNEEKINQRLDQLAEMEEVFNAARLTHPLAGMKYDTFMDYCREKHSINFPPPQSNTPKEESGCKSDSGHCVNSNVCQELDHCMYLEREKPKEEQPSKERIEDEPCLSVNDVYSFLCSYYDLKYNIPNHDILIGIAKQKLSSIKNKQQ